MTKEDVRKELDEVVKQMETIFKTLATKCNRLIEERLKLHVSHPELWRVEGTNVGFNFTNVSFEATTIIEFVSQIGCPRYNIVIKTDSSHTEVFPPWPSKATEDLKKFFVDYASSPIQGMLEGATLHHKELLKRWADTIRRNVHISLKEDR